MADAPDLVPVATVAKHLKIDASDPVLPALIAAAISHLDGPQGYLGRALVPQEITRRLSAFGTCGVRLPYPPFIAVTAIQYRDPAGTWATLPDTSYKADEDGIAALPLATLPYSNDWRVTWRAGYDGAPGRELPAAILVAICLMVGFLYANRNDTDMPVTGAAAALLRPFIVYR